MKPETIAAIERHYEHARAKHPHFADTLIPYDTLIRSEMLLRRQRLYLDEAAAAGKMDALSVAAVEVAELVDAIAKGDTAAAIEEAYDVIAVFLRIIDVLDGIQPLGNPANPRTKGTPAINRKEPPYEKNDEVILPQTIERKAASGQAAQTPSRPGPTDSAAILCLPCP